MPAVAHVPGYAAVPTLTAVHSQHLIPQPPAVHTVASPTTVLQTVQTGNAIVGHQKVGEQIVGKTPDVNGYAFKSEVRHDAPVYAPAAPVVALAAPLVGHAPLPVPVVAAPAAPLVAHPAAPGKSNQQEQQKQFDKNNWSDSRVGGCIPLRGWVAAK